MSIKPVVVFSFDDCGWGSEMLKSVQKDVAIVVTPSRLDYPHDPILDMLNIKSWKTFARHASCWEIVRENLIYTITELQRNPDGSFGGQNDIVNTIDITACTNPGVEMESLIRNAVNKKVE